MPVGPASLVAPEQLAAVRYNADGLVPAIVQEDGTGQVLMMAWMNAETLRPRSRTGRTCSGAGAARRCGARARRRATGSGCEAAYYDCDGDTLLFVVEQEGRARATPASTRASSGHSARLTGPVVSA